MRLGPNLWDDPNYVLGTIRARAAGYDIGEAAVPFRKLYVAEEIDVQDLVVEDISGIRKVTFVSATGTNIVKADNTGYLGLSGGILDAANAGGNLQLFGISYSGAGGSVFLTSSAGANSSMTLDARGSSANPFRVRVANGSGTPLTRFIIDNNGDTLGDATNGGDWKIQALGKTFQVKSGTNGKAGTFTANGASSVVVANTSVTANSVIIPTLKTVGGTPAGAPYVFAISPGVSFTMRAAAGDTSVYNYVILELIP